MNRLLKTAALTCLLALALQAQTLPNNKTVVVENNELIITGPNTGQPVQITHDGQTKHLPRWSPDGTKIAYIANVPQSKAVAEIRIVHPDGTPAAAHLFRPVGPNLIGGMNWITDLSWADNNRLLLFGEVNANNCEYALVESGTGRELPGDIVDCATFAPSPDNRHFLYADPWGMGKGPAENRRDYLLLDEQFVFPKKGTPSTIRLLAKPVWAPDATAAAVSIQNYATGQNAILIVHIGHGVTEIPLPNLTADALTWKGKTLHVQARTTHFAIEPPYTTPRPLTSP